MRIAEDYLDETIRATEWFNAFDRLYGIRRRRTNFIRRNRIIATPNEEFKGLKWIFAPRKHWIKPNRAWVIGRIIDDMAARDPFFAWGVTSNSCQTSCAVQMEWDFEKSTDPLDESFLSGAVNHDCLTFLESRGIHPHFIFTGGWSVHVAFYLARQIPKQVLRQFVDYFRLSLFNVGNPCADSLYSGMRLPLSIHHETGNLCRFAGTHSPEQVVSYAKSVIQDDVDAARIKQTVRDWVYSHPELIEQVTKRSRSDKAAVSSGANQEQDTDKTTIKEYHSLSHPSLLHKDIVSDLDFGDDSQPLIETQYVRNHAHRLEYEGYLQNGIKSGESWRIIRDSNFVFWMLHKLNSKQRVWKTLAPVLGIGVIQEVYGERLDLLRWKLHHTDFKYTKATQKQGQTQLDEEEGAWLFSLSESLHRDFTKKKACKLLSLANYLLQQLRDFGEANIGVQEVADFLEGKDRSNRTRKGWEYLAVFKEGKYKVLELTGDYKPPLGGKPGIKCKYRRVNQLPNLNAEPAMVSERLRRRSGSPVQSETIQGASIGSAKSAGLSEMLPAIG